jgi:hypothetical protein
MRKGSYRMRSARDLDPRRAASVRDKVRTVPPAPPAGARIIRPPVPPASAARLRTSQTVIPHLCHGSDNADHDPAAAARKAAVEAAAEAAAKAAAKAAAAVAAVRYAEWWGRNTTTRSS